MASNPSIRRTMLKPLRKRSLKADQKALANALVRLEEQAHGLHSLSELPRNKKKPNRWKEAKEVHSFINFAKTAYAARRLARHEYIFYVSVPIESIHDDRLMEGAYSEIKKISDKIRDVERKHGLKEGEYWPLNAGPKEHQRLNKEYDQCYEKKMVETFREFDLGELADLYEFKRKEFDRLRERGRRTVFHSDETIVILKNSILHYEEQAQQAASSGAYLAAITALGSGLEGLLLLRCLQSKTKTVKVASMLSAKKKPPKKNIDDPTKWTFDQLIEVCLTAGWLPTVETAYAQFQTAGLAHMLRLMRNNIHPGKIVRERPWWEAEERDYQDAEGIYRTLVFTFMDKKTNK